MIRCIYLFEKFVSYNHIKEPLPKTNAEVERDTERECLFV